MAFEKKHERKKCEKFCVKIVENNFQFSFFEISRNEINFKDK